MTLSRGFLEIKVMNKKKLLILPWEKVLLNRAILRIKLKNKKINLIFRMKIWLKFIKIGSIFFFFFIYFLVTAY